MIKTIDQETKKRTDNAIVNIRLIASRVKRASIEDAAQRREIVVNVLNEFRQYVNHVTATGSHDGFTGALQRDRASLERVTHAVFQADDIYHKLTRDSQKRYEQEYTQVWRLLEDVHTYLTKIIEGSNSHA